MAGRAAAVLCAALAAAGCHLVYVPQPVWTVDAEGNRVLADTAFTWSEFRDDIHRRVLDEAAGRRPPATYLSWHEYWLVRLEAQVERRRENVGKHLGYIAERRRQAGLPD
ncbi:MAG: hypothetical protein F4Z28_11885, partial [Gammaproteobacteria bacterium]|nr:hypothetical protein [Gammaproteobacteria bacterium]